MGMKLERIQLLGAKFPLVPISLAAAVIGVAAWLLKWLINATVHFVTSRLDVGGGNWWLIFVGLAGIMLTGLLVRRVVKMPIEHATDRMKAMVAQGDGTIPPRMMVAPIVASSLTLGFGGSAGSEGPIAYTGAAIGSNLGRLFGLNKQQITVAMACGAGAGIAAIFKAPVGGMFFTIEVLRMQMGVKALTWLGIMCLVSALVAYVLSGETVDFSLITLPTFDFHQFPRLLLLGICIGLYSLWYLYSGNKVVAALDKLQKPVMKNLVSGLILGVSLFLFPALFGEGYGVLGWAADGVLQNVSRGSITELLHDSKLVLPLCLAGILLLKGIACYASNSGGGVAGEFAPTLFAGGIAGLLFALLSGMPHDLAIISGMGAAMAGIVRAPIMAIFLTVEMTQQQQMLLPVSICVLVSYAVSASLKKQ